MLKPVSYTHLDVYKRQLPGSPAVRVVFAAGSGSGGKIAKASLMAMPMTMGRAISKVMAPVTASAWRMPPAALALWMTLVNSRPTRIPSSGLEKEVF